MNNKKVALIIMDGWGHGSDNPSNAIFMAETPFVNSLYKYPHNELKTSGEDVGLPDGQMGNSEVGHLNIGAGRVVFQELVRINRAIKDRTLFENKVLLDTFNYVKKNNKKLHFIGLVSDGGVHSHIEHLKALCDAAKENNVGNVFIHAFTDGRDTDPHSGVIYLENLLNHLKTSAGKIASVTGRYYSMDRDKRWERIKITYDALVSGTGKHTTDILNSVKESYKAEITDEFIKPIIVTDMNNIPVAKIEDGDAVICFNFRTDRCREITEALTQKDFPEQQMHPLKLHYTTMTSYDHTFKNVFIMYEKDDLKNTLGEILSENNKSQLRIAETEKYPHVTFFFNGGREDPFRNENRIMIPSPKVATYDLKPSMSAFEVTENVLTIISEGKTDFICLNFANADMVGHTGVFNAVVEAVQTVDTCLEKIVNAGLKNGYSFIITADHGNADFMINGDGSPNTAHTTNLVPVFLIDKEYKTIHPGRLSDLAPTILKMMDIPIPEEMTGKVLVETKNEISDKIWPMAN